MSTKLQYIIMLRGRTILLDIYKFSWYTTPCVKSVHSHMHNKALLEINILKVLEYTIAKVVAILLVTSIPLHRRSHCITPTEQR